MSRAIETCLDAVRRSPSCPKSLEQLAEALRREAQMGPMVRRAFDSAREELGVRGEWGAALSLSELELVHTSEPEEQADLVIYAARVLYEELLDQDAAIVAYERAVALRPSDAKLKDTLETILLVRGKWPDVAAKYIEEAESSSNKGLATTLLLSAAELIWRNAPEDPRIELCLRKSLEVEPRNRKAGAHLERLYREQKRAEDLAAVLTERAGLAVSRTDRVAASLKLGQIWADRAVLAADAGKQSKGRRKGKGRGKPKGNELSAQDCMGRAIDHHRRVLALEPTNEDAIGFVAGALRSNREWGALVRLHEDALAAEPPAVQSVSRLALVAGLYAEQLEQPGKAEIYYRRVRNLDPAHAAMVEFFRRRYAERGDSAKLISLLESAQRVETDPVKRMALAEQTAQVAEYELQNIDKAIDVWKGVLHGAAATGCPDGGPGPLGQAPAEAVVALKRLYRKATPPKWNALRELLKEQVEGLRADQVEEKIWLLMEMVEIYRDHLGLEVMAINTYNAVLVLKPDHTEALDALIGHYAALGRWTDLIATLGKRAEVESDAAGKVQLLHRIARLWADTLGNQGQAIAPLEAVLGVDPADAEALAGLCEIHEKRRNWQGLFDVLQLKAELGTEGRLEVLQEMASLAGSRLGDLERAVALWCQVLEDSDSSTPAVQERALKALSELYERLERWPELADVLQRRRNMSPDVEEGLVLQQTLAELYGTRLAQEERAIEAWEALLHEREEHPKAVAVLRELYARQERWEELERLLGARGMYAELAEALTAAADRNREADVKAMLYRRIGEICEVQLGSQERALKAYERVLAVRPKDEVALRMLAKLYRQTERWSRLLSTHEMLSELIAEPKERHALICDTSRLCEEELGSRHLAFQWCARALDVAPEDPQTVQELERLAASAGAWEELVAVYERRLGALSEPLSRVSLLRRLAAICTEQLRRPEQSERYHLELLDIDAEDEQAVEALVQIYGTAQRWRDLVAVYRRRVALASNSAEDAVETLTTVARIEEERLGDLAAATTTYARIADAASDPLRALKALERLHAVQSAWDSLADIMRRRLSLISDEDQQVEVLHGLAVLHQERLEDPESALNYLEQGLAIDPQHRATLKSLEGFLEGEDVRQTRAAALLESHYERVGEYEALVRVLAISLAAEPAVERQEALRGRMLAIYERRLDNPGQALEVATQLLIAAPRSPKRVEEVLRLAEVSGEQGRAVQALEQALSLVADDDGAEDSLRWELARLLAGPLERPEDAEGHLRYLVAEDPERTEAFVLLEQILRDRGDWRELREVLQARRESTGDPEQNRSLLQQIAALSEDVLEDELSAISAYENLVGLQGGDGEALRALERLYRNTARWSELSGVYDRQLVGTDEGNRRQAILIKQAEVRQRHLGDAGGAIALLVQVLDDDPESDQAVGLLEELLERGELPEDDVQLLEGCYRRRGQWAQVISVLGRRLDLEQDVDLRVALLREMATLQQDEVGDPRGAFGSLVRALKFAPSDTEVFAAVDEAVERLGLWGEAAEVYSTVADSLSDGDGLSRERLLLRLAEVQQTKLDQPETAAEALEQVLEQGPSTPEVGLDVTTRLAAEYAEQRRWERLTGVLRRRLDWTDGIPARCELLTRIAELEEERLGRLGEAADCHEEVRRLDATTPGVLDSLERLYIKLHAAEGLAGVLHSRLEQPLDSLLRRQIWRRLADLQENALDDRAATVKVHQSVLGEFPDDVESLKALARLFRASERWDELAEVLGEQLRLSTDESADQDALRLQIAELQQGQLERGEAAIEGYRLLLERPGVRDAARQALEALLESPEQLAAASEALLPVYRDEQRWGEVVRIHELRAAHTAGAERVELFEAIAKISQEKLGDLPQAYAAMDRAVRAAASSPRLMTVLDAQLQLCSAVDKWSEQVGTLEVVVQDVEDDGVRAQIYEHAARISAERLDDRPRAILHYVDLLRLAPGRVDVLSALEELYRQEGRWDDVLDTLAQQAVEVEETGGKVSALVRAGCVCRDELGQDARAIEQFERARAMDAECLEAIVGLEQLYERTERWDALALLLRERAGGAESAQQRGGFYRRLAQVAGDGLGDHSRQLQAYRELLRVCPDETDGVVVIEGLLDRPELRQEAAETLEPIYVARQQWDKVVGLYELRLEGAEDLQQRHNLTLRIAQLREEQLEDLEGALEWYGRVFLVRPEDEVVREQLLRLAGVLDRWEPVAELFESYLHGSELENISTREVALALGSIYSDRLFRWQAAQRCFERVLERRPDDLDAFEQLERLLLRYEKWSDLLSLYERAVERAATPRDKQRLLLDMARVQEQSLGNLAGAIEIYQNLLEVVDDEASAAEALERLYQQTERWGDLCSLLQRQLGTDVGPEDHVALRFRLARVYEEHLQDAASALDYYEEVLKRSPNHTGAVGALERLLLDRGLRYRIAQILGGVYRDQDQWAKLTVILEAELGFVDDPERRIELLCEIARLQEDRGEAKGAALDALRRAAQEGDQREAIEPILMQVERLADDLDRWGDVVELLERVAGNTFDPAYRVALLSRMAWVQEERLGDASEATACWNRVLAHSEGDQTAIEALQRLLPGQQQYGRLVEVLTRRAEVSSDVLVQIDSYAQVARLNEEELAQPERAVDAWQQVLALEEQHPEALDSLCRLYEQQESWQELIGIKQRRLQGSPDDEGWRRLHLDIAQVYEDRLGDRFEAIAVLKTVLQRTVDDQVVLDGLERLYEAEGLWSDLLEVVELKAIAQHDDPVARVALSFRAGEVLAEGVGDIDGAVDRFEQVAEESPEFEPVRRVLEGLLDDPTQRARVAGVLRGVYEKLGDIPALTRVLEAQVGAEADALERRDLLVSVAEIHEVQLGSPHRAFELYGRALAEDPSCESVQHQLERLAGLTESGSALVGLFEQHIEEVLDGDARRALHLKVAQLIEAQDPEVTDGAVTHYWAVLEFDGDDLEALVPLDRLLSRSERSAELIDVLERRRGVSSDPVEQAELCFRIGELRSNEADGQDAAFGAFREALELNPTNENALAAVESFADDETYRAGALELLEAVFERRGDPKAQAALWEKRLAILTGSSERAALWERLARLHEEQLDAPEAALKAMGRAVAEDPAASGLLQELERLAQRVHGFGEALEVVDALLGRPDLAADTRVALTLQAGRWLAERLDDMGGARRRYADVLALDASNEQAFERLQAICRHDGDSQGLARLLEGRATVEVSEGARARLWAEVARIEESALNRPDAAIGAWERVRVVAPHDAEALGELARLYQMQQRWKAYSEVLADQADGAGSPERFLELKHRRAEVLLERLDDVDGAAEACRDILDVAPGDETALASLERIHRAREDWHAVRDLLVQRLDVATDSSRVDVFRQLADISEAHLDAPEDAVGYYQQIRLIEPRDSETLVALERLLRKQGKWHDLIDTKRRRVSELADAGDGPGANGQLLAIARIWADDLESPDAAAEVVEEALERNPGDGDALVELARLYQLGKQWDLSLETLGRSEDLALSDAQAAELSHLRCRALAARGALAEELTQLCRRTLELNPDHAAAAKELEVLAREEADWSTVADMMEIRVRSAERAERIVLLKELGSLYAADLDRIDASVRAWERARHLDPSDRVLARGLAEAYRAAGRLDDAEPLACELIEQWGGRRSKEVAVCHHLLGSVAEERRDAAAALGHYEKAHRIDGTAGGTLAALGRLYMAAADWDAARRIYRSMLLQSPQPDWGVTRAGIFGQLGRIHVALGEKAKARTLFERGLEVDPDDESLGAALSALDQDG